MPIASIQRTLTNIQFQRMFFSRIGSYLRGVWIPTSDDHLQEAEQKLFQVNS